MALLNTLTLCFLFSILQLTATAAGENLPPVAKVASFLVHSLDHPTTNINRNLHIRDVQDCYTAKQCSLEVDAVFNGCITGDQIDDKAFMCICAAISGMPNFWQDFENCETCLQKETGNEDSGIDFAVEGPKLCQSLQGPPNTPPTPTTTTEEAPDAEETPATTEKLETTITETTEETTTETTEETTTETTEDIDTTATEATDDQTTTPEATGATTETTEGSLTSTELVNKPTVETTIATISRGNTSTTRTGLPTPSQESDLPENTDDTGSAGAGITTTAQHGFQAAVWAFGIKLVVVAGFNFIL